MRWPLAGSLLTSLLLGLAFSPPLAAAQPAPQESESMARAREEARTIAEQGLAKLDAGDLVEAARLLEFAEQRFHAPTHLLFLGQVYAGLGRLGAAAKMYRRLLAEQVPNYAPDAFRQAQELAKKEYAALEPRVPKIDLKLDREPASVELRLDGEAIAFEPTLLVDPGDHVLIASAGGASQTKAITVREGERVALTLSFEGAPDGPARPDPSPGPRPTVIGGVVALSIGGAALITGAVTGALSLSKVSDLEQRCPQKIGCDPADEALADDARLLGDVSTATLVIGGAAAVTGLVLALLPAPEPRVALRPVVGPGFIGLTGAFQ